MGIPSSGKNGRGDLVLLSGYSSKTIFASTFVLFILISLSLVPSYEGMPPNDRIYQVDDGEGDVVYVVVLGARFKKGEQIDDIDIISVIGYIEDGWMNFTLMVKGDIRKEDVYDYHISGDIDPYDERDIEFMISLEYGRVDIFFYKNYTFLDLTNTTTINGGLMNVSVPFEDPSHDLIYDLQATTYFFDRGRFRSYMDDTEPIEEYAKEDNYRIYQLIGLMILIIGISAIVVVIFSKKGFKFLPLGPRKTCSECGVIFPRRATWCPYCDEPLDK